MLCFTRERGREGAKILKYVQMQYERMLDTDPYLSTIRGCLVQRISFRG
jgi:hypothetical protein